MTDSQKSSQVEKLLRQAGHQRKSVRVIYRFQGEAGVEEHERHWEPYAIQDGHAVVFSYLRNEFRTIPLKHILSVEIRDREFEPRRPIEL